MRTNRELALAVKRALATGTIALCGAGVVAAYAQPATATQATPTQATATAKTTTAKKTTASKAVSKSEPILLAQATTAAATGPSADQTQLQTIVITGSLIERTATESPNPVQVISSKDLVQSGYTDISDVLRNISANGASTLSQSFSFAFATGASGISLRGLSLGDTLVLIDGERSVPYPLLDDNERSFVDLASIPFTAIQQVQVLKDGASALYGADAVAGVVNVILRKEYQGFHVTTEAGTSQHWDGTQEHIGFIGGKGDLASDGYNWYVSGDFRHADQILVSARSGQWDSLDFTGFGGYNRTPGVRPQDNLNIPFPNSATGYVIDPGTGAYGYLPGCDANSQASNKCTFFDKGAQLQPATTNFDLLTKFTKELSGGWELGLQASWFYSKAEQVAHLNGDINAATGTGYGNGGFTNIGLAPGQPPNVVVFPLITIPGNYPGNPFPGTAEPLIYSFPELGEQNTQVDTNTYRVLASLSGNAAGWQIDATAGAMYAKMNQWLYGNIEPTALQNALNNGYILGSATGASLFAPPAQTTPTSQLDLIDLHATHKLFDMPGGPVNFAVGVQWYKEEHDETPPPTIESGMQAGDSIYVIGTEYDRAAFAELDGNPIKMLNINLQGRYDNYKDFGSDFTPKVGFKFTPFKQIALRGTYGKGFRVPSAAEGLSSGEAFGAGNSADPVLCPNAPPAGGAITPAGDFPSQCSVALTGVLLANQKLQNVKSTNWTAGVVLQPISAASVSVDYYNIKLENDIIPVFEAGSGFASDISLVRGPNISLPYCDPTAHPGGCTTGQLTNATTPVGLILEESFPYVNASSTKTSGFDVDLQYHWDMGAIGHFTGEATWTHEITYNLTFGTTSYDLAGTHGPSGVSGDTGNPKDRINARLAWSKGPLTITPSINYISHFSIVDPSSNIPDCGSALSYGGNFPGGVTPQNAQFCNVGYFLETDLYASYQLTSSFMLHASVTNLFNKQPPVDVQTYGSGSVFLPYDAAMHQDGAVGRYMMIGFDYDFE